MQGVDARLLSPKFANRVEPISCGTARQRSPAARLLGLVDLVVLSLDATSEAVRFSTTVDGSSIIRDTTYRKKIWRCELMESLFP